MTTEPNDEELCRTLKALAQIRAIPGPGARPAESDPAWRASARISALKSRAERAEAEVARLRAAGARFCDDFLSRFSEPLTDPERAMLRAAVELRAALAGAKEKRDA